MFANPDKFFHFLNLATDLSNSRSLVPDSSQKLLINKTPKLSVTVVPDLLNESPLLLNNGEITEVKSRVKYKIPTTLEVLTLYLLTFRYNGR